MFYFLKLGGSLITDKDQPYTARRDVLERIAHEISNVFEKDSSMKLLIGHGSGSFGHESAKKHQISQTITQPSQWAGFQKVWEAAHNLNSIVMTELSRSGLPVIAFPPSASITTCDKEIINWNIDPILSAIQNRLLPVIYGDVIFDKNCGGVILSTEELFKWLAKKLQPDVILLAGIEKGVWKDYPINQQLITEINSNNFKTVLPLLHGSQYTDITGGMESKIKMMMEIIQENRQIVAQVFSGDIPMNVHQALSGHRTGTEIRYQ